MKKCTPLAIALMLAAVALAQAPIKAKISEILKDADKHTGKIVDVSGKVEKFEQKTSRRGNKYFKFVLKDGDQELNIYGQGEQTPALKDGQKVRVQGTYRKEKKLPGNSNVTIKNEVDVTKGSSETAKKNGVTVVD